MHTVLTVGPLTANQKKRLPELLRCLFRYEGIRYDPEPLEDDPDRITFTLGDLNYGVCNLGAGMGRIEELIEANIPYRATDSGSAYANGTDVIWHPRFGNDRQLTREANNEGEVVLTQALISNLDSLDDEAFGKTIRGLVATNPSDTDLFEAFDFLHQHFPTVL